MTLEIIFAELMSQINVRSNYDVMNFINLFLL